MSYLDPTTWRVFSADERNAIFDGLKPRTNTAKGEKKRVRGSNLVLQETVSPFDAYTYRCHSRSSTASH